jgi:hypothetical protein
MPRRLAVSMLILAFSLAVPGAAAGKARDRDHDRLPDKWEKRHHLPTKQRSTKGDPDRDRLTNLREYRAHTNPKRADTDRDGFKDGAEVRARTNPRKRASHPRARRPRGPRRACTGRRNTPDGRDPWGGCFPGPASTGVPNGTELTPYNGPCRITVPNKVIASKIVSCYLEIRAPNVQIRNSLINGHVDTNGGSYTITDSTIDAGEVNADVNDGNRALNGSNWTAIRVETVRGISGGWCENACRVQDSWIHGQDPDEGGNAHQSGMRMDDKLTLRHTSIGCDAPSIGDAGCSGDLTGYGDFSPVANNLIERNLFLWSTGGTCAYGGSTSSKPYPDGSNNVFRDNIFQRGPGNRGSGGRGRCGHWFPILDIDAGQRGNQWINNRWDTGGLIRADD